MTKKNNAVVLDKNDKVIHSETLESEPTIHDLLPLVMADIGSVGKDQENKHFRFKFRGIDDALNAAHPALVKHTVSVAPQVLEHSVERNPYTDKNGDTKYQSHAVVKMSVKFFAPDGTFHEAITVGESLDTGDKALSKAMAMAMKYALFFGLCIPVDADSVDEGDAEGQQHETAPPTQQQPQPPAGNPDANEMDSQTILDSYNERLDKCECSDDVTKVFEDMKNGNLRDKMRPIHLERLNAKYKEVSARYPGP